MGQSPGAREQVRSLALGGCGLINHRPGRAAPQIYFNGMRSIFAATMKSFSDKPLIEWVVNCTRQ